MRKRETTGLTILAIVIGLIVVVGLVWANHRFVSQDQGGNSFIAGWWGTRLYFTQGISPYSDEATAEIQKMVEQYGSASGKETAMFVSPFYAFIFYTPVALTDDIVLARTAWMTILEVALAVLIAFSLVLSRWRISLPFLVIVVLFSIAWYYSLRPIASGDLSMLSALLVTGAFLTIQADQDPVAGLLLALATIKPSMVLPLALLVLVWAISQRRWRLMWSFLASVALISAATSLLLPSWLPDYIRQLVELGKIPQTNTPGSLVAYWLPGIGRQFGLALTAITILILLWEWRSAWGKDFRWFLWTASLTLALTALSGLPYALDNFIVLLPGFFLVLTVWDERWGIIGRWMIFISVLALSFGVWWVVYNGSQQNIPMEQNTLLFFIPPLFMILGLYWVRWWAVRPARLPLQELARHLE